MTGARTVPGWRSGFCSTYPHADWQRAACHGGHSRTPSKADPRDWVPCVCECHHQPEEPAVSDHIVGREVHAAAAADLPGWNGNPPRELEQPAPPTLPVAADLVALAAEKLSGAALGAIEALDWEDCIRLLDLLRDAAHAIGQVDALLVRRAYLTGPHGKNAAVLDGIGPVSISRTPDRKHWDERGVARAVIDAKMADTAGEAPDPWIVAEWLLEIYGINYCRVTPLRELGLDPKQFCEETPGKPAVQLPPRS